MSLLAAPALMLLLAVPVLLWLAMRRKQPARIETGTLLIWRRVTQQAAASTRSTRRLEPLLWLLLAGMVLAGVGAARPAVAAQADPTVAVYIERIGTGDNEPLLEDAIARARQARPGATYTIYAAGLGATAGVRELNPAPLEAELAQFEALTREDSSRVLLLCAPHPAGARLGLVLPRVTERRAGVLYAVNVQGSQIFARATRGPAPTTKGLDAAPARAATDDVIYAYTLAQPQAELADAHGNRVGIQRRPFVVGVGQQWASRRHRALYAALSADAAGDDPPVIWLGSDEFKPAIRVNAGQPAELAGAEVSYDAGHALFADLPLAGIDWRGGRLLPRDTARRPLVTAIVDGQPVGDLVQLDETAATLYFAADVFEHAPIAEATLLLDNAIGVLLGQRPSTMPRASVSGDLPGTRASHAGPFEPQGSLQENANPTQPQEFATWLLALAALAALAAAVWQGAFQWQGRG